MEVSALLPWWGCLILAVASWYLFGWLASRPMPPPDPKAAHTLIFSAATRAWSIAAQFGLPLIFGFAAILSGAARLKRGPSVGLPSPSMDRWVPRRAQPQPRLIHRTAASSGRISSRVRGLQEVPCRVRAVAAR